MAGSKADSRVIVASTVPTRPIMHLQYKLHLKTAVVPTLTYYYILLLEKVQRRFTKSIPTLHRLPYITRLSKLKLISLSDRRVNIDLCTVYRILYHQIFLDSSLFFTMRFNSITRGHVLTLCKPPVRLDSSKFAFHARVVDPWNALPPDTVSSISINAFKSRLRSAAMFAN